MPRAGSAALLRDILLALGAEGATGELTVHGTSMLPSIADGDRVRLVPADTVRLGDVVLRRRGAALILHRVVGWWRVGEGWRVLTKGDGERALDPPADPGDMIGKAVVRITAGQIEPLACERARALRSLAAGLCWELCAKARRLVASYGRTD